MALIKTELVSHLLLMNLVIKQNPKYPDRSAAISSASPYLTQVDGAGMMEREEQQRM